MRPEDIDANHGDSNVECLGHGVLLVLGAPSQLLTLVGAGARPDQCSEASCHSSG
jgi:hypothetical protein